jgi:hypothetical protein
MADIEIVEDHIDNTSINLYYWFTDVNNDELFFRCEDNENIEVTIFQENGTVVLKPTLNWNGHETLTFFASDDFNEVSDKIDVIVTPVNDPPDVPEIISPKDKVEIEDGTSLVFKGECSDPDIMYDDKLTFTWTSNISGEIGKGKNLKDIVCSVGNHLITLEVSDREGETSSAQIILTVLETLSSDSDNDGLPNIWERDQGLDPFNGTDAQLDNDNDGLTNLEEFKLNTKPLDPDSDGDDFNDKLDLYPLDPDKWDKEISGNNEGNVMWEWVAVFVIVIVILIILYFFIIRRKKIHIGSQEDMGDQSDEQTKLGKTEARIDPQNPQEQQIEIQQETSENTQQENKVTSQPETTTQNGIQYDK